MTEERAEYRTERYTIICGTCARKFICPWRHEKRETCQEYEIQPERPKPPGPERAPTGYWTAVRRVPVGPGTGCCAKCAYQATCRARDYSRLFCEDWVKAEADEPVVAPTQLTLRQLQAEVGAWHRQHFPKATTTLIVLKALEEVAELAAVHNQKRVVDDIPADGISEPETAEIGDVLIVLASLCDRLGLDIVQVFNRRWQTIKARDTERIHRGR